MSIPIDTSETEYNNFITYIMSIYDPNNSSIYQYISASKLISRIENYISQLELYRDIYMIKTLDSNAQTDLDAVNFTSTIIDTNYFDLCSNLLQLATLFSIFIRNT